MNKLLHERLREWVKESEQTKHLPTVVAHHDLEFDSKSIINEQIELFNYFADEIKRYYIPRQRDNKGRPYHIGETVYSVDPETEYSAEIIDINETGIIRIKWEDGSTDYVDKADIQHEPPQPKVLDADGVPIKVGENRFSTRTGEYLAVNKVGTEYCLCTVLGNGYTLGTCSYKPSELSSKEPDSIERIISEMQGETWDHLEVISDKVEQWARRLSALIKRGA